MSRNADHPSAAARRALIDLVRQVADADRRAFARLYEALAPAVAGNLRAAMPDPADAAAITSATFVEVWWLARFHAAAGTDVSEWIMAIAARRAAERLGADGKTGTDDHPSAVARSPLWPTPAMQDEHHAMALAGLLHDHVRPVNGRVPARGEV